MLPIELPHSRGCLVCGHDNPRGLGLSLFVDPASGLVTVHFKPRPEHIGFQGIPHGGVLATVADEAMVWTATWQRRRFCICGEMAMRFRRTAQIGMELVVQARIQSSRPKLVVTEAQFSDCDGVVATASGKYVPLSAERNQSFMQTLIDEPSTHEAAVMLRAGDAGTLGAED